MLKKFDNIELTGVLDEHNASLHDHHAGTTADDIIDNTVNCKHSHVHEINRKIAHTLRH